jgi:hypothetical protein
MEDMMDPHLRWQIQFIGDLFDLVDDTEGAIKAGGELKGVVLRHC